MKTTTTPKVDIDIDKIHTHELSLVIPCYNEEENIEKVAIQLVNELTSSNINFELILVDNGSYDNTARILNDLTKRYSQIKIVTIRKNEGYGWGIINGLKNCTGNYVGFLCADGQISPKDVIAVFRKLKSEDLDLCKVKRMKRYDGLYRLFLSKSYNFLFQFFCPVSTNDVNGTPKIMKYNCYEKLNISSKDWFIDAEIIIKAESSGFKIDEVPAEFRKRKRGKSNVRFTIIFEFLKNLIKYKLRGL